MGAKGLTEAKTKSFTFRITESMSKDIAKAKQECSSKGIRWNVTEALTDALERELKAVQKHIQE